MNILVTGGAGFIGSHTVVELLSAGHTPIILDNFSHSHKSVLDGIKKITNVDVVVSRGDATDPYTLNELFSQYQIDGIIHFAAYKAVGESIEKPLRYWQNNIGSLLAILQMAQSHHVQSFVFSSSATIYGEPDFLPIPETAPRKPATSPYGSTKQSGEDLLHDTVTAPDSFLKGISLRYFNPIGAHPSGLIGELPIGTPQNLVPFVTQTAAGIREKITIFGNNYDTPDGTCLRDYIHVIDLAKAHIQALEYLLKPDANQYDVFNIGTGTSTSVLDIIKTFEHVNATSVPYEIGERRKGDVVQCYADPSKANATLKWKSRHTLEEALRDAWNWQRRLGKK